MVNRSRSNRGKGVKKEKVTRILKHGTQKKRQNLGSVHRRRFSYFIISTSLFYDHHVGDVFSLLLASHQQNYASSCSPGGAPTDLKSSSHCCCDLLQSEILLVVIIVPHYQSVVSMQLL